MELLCPHPSCDFYMSIDVLFHEASKVRTLWRCLKCSCSYSTDGALRLIAVRTEVCSEGEQYIGEAFG